MDRNLAIRLGKCVVVIAAACACSVAMTASADAQTRHHISIGIGYSKLLSDDLKDESLSVDFTNAAHAGLAYRYSLNPQVDLTIDSQATVSTDNVAGVDLTLTNSFFGPGVRYNMASDSPRPFLQANVFYVSETAEAEQGGVRISGSDSGAGFGLTGGIDIRMTPLLSLPITVHYLEGKPADDVSGIGFNIALAFNFGGSL